MLCSEGVSSGDEGRMRVCCKFLTPAAKDCVAAKAEEAVHLLSWTTYCVALIASGHSPFVCRFQFDESSPYHDLLTSFDSMLTTYGVRSIKLIGKDILV